MDNQLPTPNTPSPAERPAPITPDVIMPSKAPESIPAAPAEAQIVMPSAAPAGPVVNPQPAVPAATPSPAPTPAAPLPGTPAVAGDVDVIEPEWVDQAEQVIAAHQGDPYGEEEAIEKLQEDYLQKRYGMNVTDPNSGSSKPEGS